MGELALVTGFPGFIAGHLIRALLGRGDDVCALALPQSAEAARAQAARIEADCGRPPEIVTGDITCPGLALDPEDAARILPRVGRVYHLAAIYDLSVSRAFAEQVNVDGTRHVLDLCERLPALERLVYFSTCYVAGRRSGRIVESELELGQSFRNQYEATKHAAEVLVRGRRASVPTVVIRPAIVAGDSRTGATAKYDGPYFLIASLARMERLGVRWLAAFYPDFGPGRVPFNVVPVDYVVAGTVALSHDATAIGGTFHLSDPRPLTTGGFTRAVFSAFGLSGPYLRVPAWLGRAAFRVPGVSELMGIPAEAFDYYDLSQTFDTTEASARLAPLGIHCPSPPEYLRTLIEYVRANPVPQRGPTEAR